MTIQINHNPFYRAKLFLFQSNFVFQFHSCQNNNLLKSKQPCIEHACWRAYRRLPEYGFQHKWINHDLYYCDPEDKSLNTNRIEKRGGDNTTAKNDINPLLENCVVFLLKTEGVVVFSNFAKICLKE